MKSSSFRAIGWIAVGVSIGMLFPSCDVPSWSPWVIAITGGLLVLGSYGKEE